MIVALDLETTGLSKEKDFIIEIAMIKFDENTFEIIEEYSTLVNPWIKIPDLNVNITWITDEMVMSEPYFDELINKIESFIWDATLLWHNTYFDRDFLIEKWVKISNNIVFDTFFIANFLSIKCKSMSLESLALHYSIDLVWAHRAYNDTKATMQLFKILLGEFDKLEDDRKRLLSYFFFTCADKNIEALKNLLYKEESNINFNDFVSLQLDKIERNNQVKFLEEDEINETMRDYFFKIPDFEDRDSQINMADKIYNNFFANKKTVIEAPTWIWKTLAYLIPSIIYAKKVHKKVFISTKTKILQDQIYYKDLATVSKNLWIKFNYTKIKWKKNYISLKSFFDFIKDFTLDYEKVSFLSKISLWLCDTKFGEFDELFYTSNEYRFLKYVNSDNIITLDKKNPYLKKEFVYKQKINLELADIVVVNHSLLFSDLKNDFNYFGKVENLVIDEAHSIEDIATESLKSSFTIKVIEDLISFAEFVFRNNFFDGTLLSSKKEDLLSNLNLFLDIFHTYLKHKTNNENFFINSLLDESFYSYQNEYFYKLWSNIKNILTDIKIELLDVKYDFSREVSQVDKIVDIIDKIIDKDNGDEYIKIAHYREQEGVKLEYTILDIWKYLRINFWDNLDNCFLLSATLSVAENFDYVKKSLHLENFEFTIYETDFDYKKQATLYIPKDIGSIKNNFSKVLEFLQEAITVLKWNTMILFTSLSAVRNVYINLNFYTQSIGSKLLAQSIYWSKNKVLESFLHSHNNSIILWTDSFWEWVDIPWEPLKYLIIHKIPFLVPTDPIFLSRSKLFVNPFLEYSVPKSILKLKQWFWRLIRTKKDNWVVIFLDDRIYSTQWWKVFINAFPKDIKINLTQKKDIIEFLHKK